MKTKHKKSVIILTVIAIFIAVPILCHFIGMWRAVSVAKDYLDEKYETEMKFRSVYRYSIFVDDAHYDVTFSPVNNSDIRFQVMVGIDLTIRDGLREFGRSSGSADNYYLRCFEDKMEKFLADEVKDLWGNEAYATAFDTSAGIYSYYVSPDLTDTMTLEEMEPLINEYWLHIYTESELNADSLEAHANQIFTIVTIINDNGFSPDTLDVNFYDSNQEEIYVLIKELSEIKSVDQIRDQLQTLLDE